MNVNDGTVPCPHCGSGHYENQTKLAHRVRELESMLNDQNKVVWPYEDAPFTGAQVKELLEENARLENHVEELIAEAFGVEEGIVEGKTTGKAILKIRALYDVVNAAVAYVKAFTECSDDEGFSGEALEKAVRSYTKEGE